MDNLFAVGEAEKGESSHIIRVAFESGVDSCFDYLVPAKFRPIEPGRRVEVPFGRSNKLQIGFCIEAGISPDKSFASRGKKHRLKKVTGIIDAKPLLDAELMALGGWISSYYVCPLGQVLAAMVPAAVKKGIGAKTEIYIYLAIPKAHFEEVIKSAGAKKQKQIVELLYEKQAFGAAAAVGLQELLEQLDCTDGPIKRLAEKQVIRITKRTVFRSLPAIPEGMTIRAEKVILNEDQQKALTHVEARINSGGFGVTLIYGVTDSGKTELYIRAIEAVLKRGKSAIIMLPEIALTTQTVQRFSARFEKIAVMHSGLGAAQRNTQWRKIKAGQANVVIGARSAIFAPLSDIGLIVVDEEHEPSYKQDTVPRYNGRDVAIKRAQLAGAFCILGTATPSLETMYNCQNREHFSLVRLPKRVQNLPMPEMRLVDMTRASFHPMGFNMISAQLQEKLREVLARREQAILLLNRRGYSNYIFCPSCKHTLRCRNCDVALTFHKSSRLKGIGRSETIIGKHLSGGYALCHYCFAQSLVPEKCPLCGRNMIMFGIGSQKLEEELVGKFPAAQVARVDSDSMRAGDYYRVLRDFGSGKTDILAGTQMLAKGLHFPNVTLVGIICADTALSLPDFRANERTFQLISQVAGRAGRSAKKGVVIVQTFLPEQPAIQFALRNDYAGFIEEECKHRRACNLPPYWRLAGVIMRDEKYDKLTEACNAMREKIDAIAADEALEVNVTGPMEAPISRIQRFHRMQIIIKAPRASVIQQLFRKLRVSGRIHPAVKVAIDIDPVNLM